VGYNHWTALSTEFSVSALRHRNVSLVMKGEVSSPSFQFGHIVCSPLELFATYIIWQSIRIDSCYNFFFKCFTLSSMEQGWLRTLTSPHALMETTSDQPLDLCSNPHTHGPNCLGMKCLISPQSVLLVQHITTNFPPKKPHNCKSRSANSILQHELSVKPKWWGFSSCDPNLKSYRLS
jgi:hypothetical protein